MSFKYESETKQMSKVTKPPLYSVIMHNDDYTTMDFVVDVLVHIFDKNQQEAAFLMMKIHETGLAAVGRYVYDIAVTKQIQTMNMARETGFPLRLTLKEEIE